MRLTSVSWVGEKTNGGEEAGWYRVFQKREIINMPVGCVFGTCAERKRKKWRCKE